MPVCQISHLIQKHRSVWLSWPLLTSFNLSSSFCSVCLDTSTSMICCRRISFSSSALTRFSSTLSSSWCSLTETSLATWSEEHKCMKRIPEEQQLQYFSYSRKHITALDSSEILNSVMSLLMKDSKPFKYQNEYPFLIQKSKMKIHSITHFQLFLHIKLRQCHEQQDETSRYQTCTSKSQYVMLIKKKMRNCAVKLTGHRSKLHPYSSLIHLNLLLQQQSQLGKSDMKAQKYMVS